MSERCAFFHSRDGTRLALTEIHRATRAQASRAASTASVEGWAGFAGPGPQDGPPVLLVHGLAQNRLAFTLGPLPELLLDRGCRVFVGELRGHGKSKVDGSLDHSIEHYLEQDLPTLLAGVASLADGPVHYVGHSLGGLLAYLALARKIPGLASVTAIAAPLRLGAGRPDVRILAALTRPFAGRLGRVPLDTVLRALSGPLSGRGRSLALIQRYIGLTNPALAEPESLRQTLVAAEAESPEVFLALIHLAISRRGVLHGIDLEAAVEGAAIPVAAVVGERDLFANEATVAPLLSPGAKGPRRVEVIARAGHVDLALGHHWPGTLERLWPFLSG
jgi:pimeloyl-ACP methyl ester carboxylesterase